MPNIQLSNKGLRLAYFSISQIQLFRISLMAVLMSFTSFVMHAQEPFGPEQIISNSADNAQSVYSADLDGDGDMDVLSASFYDDKIAWYENDGNGNFSQEIVISLIADGASAVYSADMDGDGDMDVFSAARNAHKVAWYENDGNGNFGEEIHVSLYAEGATSVYCADVDGDGDLDVLAALASSLRIVWYENVGNGTFVQGFGQENLITMTGESPSLYYADIDGDGDVDVFSGSSTVIAWHENDGNGNFGQQNVINPNGNWTRSLHSEDLDGDGDMDLLAASFFDDDNIAWYENDGNGNFGQQNIISQSVDNPESVYSADLDGDGDMDVLSASDTDDKIAWYENDGSGSFGEQNVISLTAYGALSLFSADLNGDGDMDVLSASSETDKIAWYKNQFDCTDPEACNYNPNALVDNGSCCYGICGCNDPQAENYDPLAECSDNTCQYRLEGMVFFDENENGIKDPDEYGIPNQELSIQPMGWITSTNDNGEFSFIGPGTGNYSIELGPNESFPFFTTDNPQELEVIWNQENEYLYFGVSNETPIFGIFVDFYPPGFGYPCNDWVNHNICYRNEGNVPIDGVVELEFHELFQDYAEVTPIDSVIANRIYMSFQNLLPGQMFCYDVNLLTPHVDFIDYILSSTARVYGYHEGDLVAYGDKDLHVPMTCAYDPNDKQAFPMGYHDDHLILNGTEIEYLVRFQNTGNAPATNVLVTDTIDENLDLSSFSLMANSHSVVATIKPEIRVIEFLFENIMLPDSTNNEPESHGFVSYLISPNESLEPGTEINNTANIYFDNNPPIITNTTWHTIHECGGEAAFTSEVDIYCSGYHTSLEATYPLAETYRWSLGDEIISDESSLAQVLTEIGTHEFELRVGNPLCSEVTFITVEVEDYSTASSCPGDINCNGERGLEDLTLLLAGYGCSSSCEYDLNNDSITSFGDVQVFLSFYGTGCED